MGSMPIKRDVPANSVKTNPARQRAIDALEIRQRHAVHIWTKD
jgi:hypothetical protein